MNLPQRNKLGKYRTPSWLIFAIALKTFPGWANDIIDVYGVSPVEAKQIIQKYAIPIREIEMHFSKLFAENEQGVENSAQLNALYQQKYQLIETIKRENHFAFVDVQTVTYPNKPDIYSTIEIIADTHSPRLQFIHHSTAIKPRKKIAVEDDLITAMMAYHRKAIHLLMSQQIDLADHHCPVYHCAVPFTHPDLKPYLTVFNQGIKQHKATVIDTLNHDPDPERRAAAAFLIGHLTDPHEIVTILSPHISDASTGVRNNVLRVIGETIWRAKINDINAAPYMALLGSPYVTDRNKSLIILYTIAGSASGKKQIAANNHGQLEALARLKQPNNHDMAIKILNKIH